MDDFKARGKYVDAQYMKIIVAKKKNGGKATYVPPVIPKPEPKPPVVIPADIVGKLVKHKAFGVGRITAIEDSSIAVDFDKVGLKKMGALDGRLTPQSSGNMYSDIYKYRFKKVL